jgi:hypothetical protein
VQRSLGLLMWSRLRLFQLDGDVFPPLRVVDPELSNLPVRPTRLIGRDRDVINVRRTLDTNRLVTVTAVGGSGKTRLVIAVGLCVPSIASWLVRLRFGVRG